MQTAHQKARDEPALCQREAALDGFLWALAEVAAGVLFRRASRDSSSEELDGSTSGVVVSRQGHDSSKSGSWSRRATLPRSYPGPGRQQEDQ